MTWGIRRLRRGKERDAHKHETWDIHKLRRSKERDAQDAMEMEEAYAQEHGIVPNDFQCRFIEGHSVIESFPGGGHCYTTDDSHYWGYKVTDTPRCSAVTENVYDIMIYPAKKEPK